MGLVLCFVNTMTSSGTNSIETDRIMENPDKPWLQSTNERQRKQILLYRHVGGRGDLRSGAETSNRGPGHQNNFKLKHEKPMGGSGEEQMRGQEGKQL